MKTFAIALTIILSAGAAFAQEPVAKRPRDRYLQAGPVDQDGAKRVIAAIESYRKILATKDYKRFYLECVHSTLKQRVTEEQFTAQIATVPEILSKFFDDILEAYAKKGSKDADFQIGTMPSTLVPGTLMIQFADRIDAEPKVEWPKGAPVRIQLADDDGTLRFYDID
jgi:hypothetical protein